jgi:hypothetical protein
LRFVPFLVVLAACGGSSFAAPQAAPLDRSLFPARGSSGLSEADLGAILDAPLALRLPARVGVVALDVPFTAEPRRDLHGGVTPVRKLTDALESAPGVLSAVEVSAAIPSGDGVEGLREIAARYRVPYLLMYSETVADHSGGNVLSPLWITIVGGLISPCITVEGRGVVEATLLDVRTGTMLFTTREAVEFSAWHFPIGSGAAYEELLREKADAASARLAARVRDRWQHFTTGAGEG